MSSQINIDILKYLNIYEMKRGNFQYSSPKFIEKSFAELND